jgi:RecJ-like exonuclease
MVDIVMYTNVSENVQPGTIVTFIDVGNILFKRETDKKNKNKNFLNNLMKLRKKKRKIVAIAFGMSHCSFRAMHKITVDLNMMHNKNHLL